MICEKCGRNIPTWESECSECAGTTSFFSYEPVRSEPKLTREQFAKHPNVAIARKKITTCAVWMYVLAGINIAALLAFGMSDPLDIIIIIACAVVIQVKQSKTAAIVFTVYAVLNMVMMLIMYGRAGGWLILYLATKAYSATAKFQGHWRQYQITGSVPFVTK